jgi:hypothetical protein
LIADNECARQDRDCLRALKTIAPWDRKRAFRVRRGIIQAAKMIGSMAFGMPETGLSRHPNRCKC